MSGQKDPDETSTTGEILLRSSVLTNLIEHYTRLSHAPHELQLQSEHLKNMEELVEASKKRLDSARCQTVITRAGYTDLRDSKARRWASTVAGRKDVFNSRTEQEENGYVDALETEIKLKAELEAYQQQLDEARTARRRLEESCDTLYEVQTALDVFYESIFSGPTPEFPQEDELEQHVSSVVSMEFNLEAQIAQEQGALDMLIQAEEKARYLKAQIEHVQRRFRMSGERKEGALGRVHSAALEVNKLVHRAHLIQPQIQDLDEKWVNFKAHYAMDNAAFRPWLDEMVQGWRETQTLLKQQVTAERRWVTSLRTGLEQTQSDLEQAQKELRVMREQIVQRIVRDHVDRLPAYDDDDPPPP